jgi:hypothetical protein
MVNINDVLEHLKDNWLLVNYKELMTNGKWVLFKEGCRKDVSRIFYSLHHTELFECLDIIYSNNEECVYSLNCDKFKAYSRDDKLNDLLD